jgi:hypothetical protein
VSEESPEEHELRLKPPMSKMQLAVEISFERVGNRSAGAAFRAFWEAWDVGEARWRAALAEEDLFEQIEGADHEALMSLGIACELAPGEETVG